MALIAGLQSSSSAGLYSGLNNTKGANAGAGGVYVPTTSAEFTALGITAPSSLWLAQEASGNLTDSLGTLTLSANASPLYTQQVAGWARYGVGFNEQTAQRFQAAAGVGPDVATQSVAWLVYLKLAGVQGGTRRVLHAAEGFTTTGVQVAITTSNQLQLRCVNVGTTGSYDYNDGAVHPVLLAYNRTAGTVRIYTDKEQINGTYSAGAVDAAKGWGASAGTSFLGQILYGFAAGGATAEGYAKSTLSALGWSLAY